MTLTSPATLNDLVTIVSSITENRVVDYQNNGDFRPVTVNNDFDRSISLVKQLSEEISRVPRFQTSEQGVVNLTLPDPVSGQSLAWKADLTGLENIDPGSVTPGAAASTTTYNNATSGRSAINVQTALDEAFAENDAQDVVIGQNTTDITSNTTLKAPLASPALTGTPTAPTQTAGDDSTRLATTAFVQEALPVTGLVGNYDVILAYGLYTSGTFSIPGGRTWDDYDIVKIMGVPDSSYESGNSAEITAEGMTASLNSWELIVNTDFSQNSQITATSATQFSVSRDNDDVLRMVIGYRKAGVA